MGTFDELVTKVAQEHAGAVEHSIHDQLGFVVRQTVNVTIRRPRWMPKRVYAWLLGTIVVQTGPMRIESD